MAETQSTITTDRTIQLAAELVKLKENADRLKVREDEIKAELRTLGEGRHNAGDFTVELVEQRRLDEGRVRDQFPLSDYPHLYSTKTNTTAVRGFLGEQYDEYLVPLADAKLKVTVK